MTEIDLGVLGSALRAAVGAIAQATGDRVRVDADYYWVVDPGRVLQPYEGPGEPGLGQLTECVERIAYVARRPECAVTYDLVLLGDVLRALGLGLGSEIAAGGSEG